MNCLADDSHEMSTSFYENSFVYKKKKMPSAAVAIGTKVKVDMVLLIYIQ